MAPRPWHAAPCSSISKDILATENAPTIELTRIERRARPQACRTPAAPARRPLGSQAGSNLAWGAPVVSTLIVAGVFFCVYRLFILPVDLPPNAFQLLNGLFGGQSIAFGPVCNYWLGSSAGTKASGDAVRKIAEQRR